jgi:pumilio family protein 6
VVDPPLNFATILYANILSHVVEWAKGDGSFVVVALLETLTAGEADSLKKQLKNELTRSKNTGNKGTKIVLEKIA